MSEINLISADQKRLFQIKKTVWIVSIIAGVTLAVSSVLAVSIYSLHLIEKKQISQQEGIIANLQQQIIDLSKIEQRQALIYDRVNSSQKLLGSRPELKKRLDSLVETFPEGTVIESIKIDTSAKASEVAIKTDSFIAFFNTLKIIKGGGFYSVNLDSINRDKYGTYIVKMIITL